MKKLQLLFAFLAHTQVSVVLLSNNLKHCYWRTTAADINVFHSFVFICPTEGGLCSQKLLGSVSAPLVQREFSAGLFRVPQISFRQVF